jgi:hypothetical protein
MGMVKRGMGMVKRGMGMVKRAWFNVEVVFVHTDKALVGPNFQ